MLKFMSNLVNKSLEQKSLLDTRTRSLAEAEKKIEELKHLRLLEQYKNANLSRKLNGLQLLLSDILNRIICAPLGSERIILNKIKELVRDHKSKNQF